MSFYFDNTLKIEKLSDAQFIVDATNAYWNFVNVFGGWLAAASVKAVSMRSDYRGDVVSLNVSFIASVASEKISLKIDLVERKRTVDFWRLLARDFVSGKILFSVDIISGKQRDSELNFYAPLPEHKSIEESFKLEAGDMVPKWLAHIDQRLAKGRPLQVNENAQSVLFTRDSDERPFDALTAITHLDTPMPRPFFLDTKIRMSSTLMMSTHLYATPEEFDAVGNDYCILVADSASVAHAFFNQEARLYRRDGVLLASSYQTALAR